MPTPDRPTVAGHVRSVACPTCGAAPNAPCVSAGYFHVARRRLANVVATENRPTATPQPNRPEVEL